MIIIIIGNVEVFGLIDIVNFSMSDVFIVGIVDIMDSRISRFFYGFRIVIVGSLEFFRENLFLEGN